jgi:hypothetical protein
MRRCRRNERRNGDWKYGNLEKRGEKRIRVEKT